MHRKLLITAVATVLLTGSALDDCRDDVEELNADMAPEGELTLGMRSVGSQDVRELRDADYIFAHHGDEDACEDLIGKNLRNHNDEVLGEVEAVVVCSRATGNR